MPVAVTAPPCKELGTAFAAELAVAGQGGNHPAEMEMSWEAPALWRPSCQSHCAY